MDTIDTLDALEAILKSLVTRRLVVYLGDPDRRGALVTHGFHAPEELARLKSHAPLPAAEPESAPAASAVPAVPPEAVGALEAQLAAALAEIAALKGKVAGLEAGLADVRKQLGLTPGAV
jgi:hypothetical protein